VVVWLSASVTDATFVPSGVYVKRKTCPVSICVIEATRLDVPSYVYATAYV
jgi:hypothetical protein